MSSVTPLHPDPSRLLDYADGEMSRAERHVIEIHLVGCEQCREEVANFRQTLRAFDGYHGNFKRRLPEPPKPWVDMRARLDELDAGRVQILRKPSFRVPMRWAAAAAGLVIAVLLYQLSGERTVSADELLAKAAVGEVTTESTRRIRIKTRRSAITRPARATAIRAGVLEEEQLASLFRKANFSWEEPLSARSFATWRSGLSRKDDRLRILNQTEFGTGRFYRLTTSTGDGELAAATITIRAADMRAVHESLEFRQEGTVEISEAPAQSETPGDALSTITPPPEPNAADQMPVSPSEELKVIAALHAINADTGEPIEVARNASGTTLDVNVLGVSAARREQIRLALSGMQKVQLHFEDPQPVRDTTAATTKAETARVPSALEERLGQRLGSNEDVASRVDALLIASESALARAHALRALAERFAPAIEGGLPSTDVGLLASIRQDHARQLNAALREIGRGLQVLGPAATAPPIAVSGPWQQLSREALVSVQRLDGNLTRAFAANAPISDADALLARIQSDLVVASQAGSMLEAH